MMRPTRFCIPVALLACAVVAAPAHAGWGDALKSQANKAIKHEKKPAKADAGPIESRIEPQATPENIAKFKTALQTEMAEREKVTKFLATVKSPEAYQKCHNDWVLGPEGQKLGKRYAEGMDGKSGAELQKQMETIGKEMEQSIEKACGPDPGHYGQGWASQQTREAIGKASDQFAEDDYAYGTWKEWVLEFCKYVEALKKQPDSAQKLAKIKDEGLRIPGSGTGIYYVYTASEANALLEQCETLVPLIQATL